MNNMMKTKCSRVNLNMVMMSHVSAADDLYYGLFFNFRRCKRYYGNISLFGSLLRENNIRIYLHADIEILLDSTSWVIYNIKVIKCQRSRSLLKGLLHH